MKYDNITEAVFIKRLNRFVALCRIDGKDEYCHVKNTGRCSEILIEGARCFLEKGTNPTRKYRYSLVAVEKGSRLINIDSQAPNKAVAELLSSGRLFSDIKKIQPEKTYGKSRFDFYFEHGDKKAFLEVKGVTLENDNRVSFPDAPTQRGTKHLEELSALVSDGYEAYVMFVVQMKNVTSFSPAKHIDPVFSKALKNAFEKGVRVFCYDCFVGQAEMVIADEVEVIL